VANKKSKNGQRSSHATGPKRGATRIGQPASSSAAARNGGQARSERTYNIPDWRLEKPELQVSMARDSAGAMRYTVSGKLDAPVPPIRESRYLSKEKSLELYRWMLLNRRMEQVLETLYKQSKVVGGVYFGLGQEACSCGSALALTDGDWFAPMIRNQGALLVRGFHPRDVMMQYMAKSGSPTHGKDGTSHFGDIGPRGINMVSPISMLGDLIPILSGVALGARLQGANVACLTWIGDGGQSTGVTYEGLNFAAVQKLGLVLIVESNLWAYATPMEMQVAIRDLAERAIGYGIPGVIIDGTDACQVYDASYEAVRRAHDGGGPTLIEAKMMRMKGHAIHDAAAYVPKEMLEFWKRRDPIARFENHLMQKNWLTAKQNEELIASVDAQIDADRQIAEASPMPDPADAPKGVYCDEGCHPITKKYGGVKVKGAAGGKLKQSEAALHFK
jgi:TPP-dependent pyruvate/acetoin dehydrogenase alpha subunit